MASSGQWNLTWQTSESNLAVQSNLARKQSGQWNLTWQTSRNGRKQSGQWNLTWSARAPLILNAVKKTSKKSLKKNSQKVTLCE